MDKYKHDKTVRHTDDEYSYTEYDAYDRVTFYVVKSNNYWCLKFYDEPKEGRQVNMTPYNVVHKWWEEYNGLK